MYIHKLCVYIYIYIYFRALYEIDYMQCCNIVSVLNEGIIDILN